jgi:hypothetical protein
MYSCYNLILQNFFYMFQALQVLHQTFSCTVQALWYWYQAHSPNHKTASIAVYLLHFITHIDYLP